MATPKASTKAWWLHPSSDFTLFSSPSTLSMGASCMTQAVVAWCTSASLMALAAWASFRHATSVLHLSPALCVGNLWWPCLQVITLGSHSFSPLAEVALTVWLVYPWRRPEAMWQRGCLPPAVSSAGAIEKWFGQRWGSQLEWTSAETSVRQLPLRQGWQGPSSLAWGDFWFSSCWQWLFRWSAVLVGRGRQRLKHFGKPPAVTSQHLEAAGWWLQWCCQKVQHCLLEGIGLV